MLLTEKSEKSPLQSPASQPLPGNFSGAGASWVELWESTQPSAGRWGPRGGCLTLKCCSLSSYAVERKIEPFYKGGKVQVPALGGAEWWGGQGLLRAAYLG